MSSARKYAKDRAAKLPGPTLRLLYKVNRYAATCELCERKVPIYRGRVAQTGSGEAVVVCGECADGLTPA